VGYSNEDLTNYKYYFATVEKKNGQNYLRTYELVPENDQINNLKEVQIGDDV